MPANDNDTLIRQLMPWIAFSWFLAGGAIIGLAVQVVMSPQITDSKIAAGIAPAEERARTADVNARVALDKVEDFRAKLAEKGINVALDGH